MGLFFNAQKRSKEREMSYQLPDPKKPTQVFDFFFGVVRECRAHLLPLAVTVTVVVVAELARLPSPRSSRIQVRDKRCEAAAQGGFA